MTNTLIDAVERITAQLDARVPDQLRGLPDLILRAMKVQEEAGELAAALIGILGQNPRKGITHTTNDAINEAIDVAISALVFIESVEPGQLDTILTQRLAYLETRANQSGAPSTTDRHSSRSRHTGGETR
jgi:hypothetical protein